MRGARAGYGTLSWARARGGSLTLRESVREIAKGVRVLVPTLPMQIRQRLGFRNPRAFAYDLEKLPVPDSAFARQAEELCREASPPIFVEHCFRTYAWGMILAAADGLRPDVELFWVASLLHDLALTERFRSYAPMPCFGARAGILAVDWARDRGWTEARCATLGDAISLHLNTTVPAEHGPEAQLLHAGAGLDVIGLRHWDVAPETIAEVLRRHPRHGMKTAGYPAFVRESHSRTRASLLQHWLCFGALVRHAPFAE
jgi:hypothetical protein